MRPSESPTIKKLVRQWLDKAEQDMQAAEILLDRNPPLLYPSCFHAQQAGEKYIKALLTYFQIEFPKTHIIGELLDLIATVDPDLAVKLNSATGLTPYGVEVRYPGDVPEPDRDAALKALDIARRVSKIISSKLPDL